MAIETIAELIKLISEKLNPNCKDSKCNLILNDLIEDKKLLNYYCGDGFKELKIALSKAGFTILKVKNDAYKCNKIECTCKYLQEMHVIFSKDYRFLLDKCVNNKSVRRIFKHDEVTIGKNHVYFKEETLLEYPLVKDETMLLADVNRNIDNVLHIQYDEYDNSGKEYVFTIVK